MEAWWGRGVWADVPRLGHHSTGIPQAPPPRLLGGVWVSLWDTIKM